MAEVSRAICVIWFCVFVAFPYFHSCTVMSQLPESWPVRTEWAQRQRLKLRGCIRVQYKINKEVVVSFTLNQAKLLK